MKKSKIIIIALFLSLTTQSAQANIALLLKGICDLIAGTAQIMSVAEAKQPASEKQKWINEFNAKNEQYRKSIPKNIIKEVNKKYPTFKAITFQGSKVASSDYNCDGKPDYAIVGLTKEDKSIFTSTNLKKVALSDLKQELHKYKYEMWATTLVVLSSNDNKFILLREKGSYASNGGTKVACGDSNKKSKEISKLLKDNKCEFLYIGCCEKDGSYDIWKKNSEEKLYSGGC